MAVGFGEAGFTEAAGLEEALTDAEGDATLGLADAEADGLGSREGLGSTEGTTTTSGEGAGSGFEVTLSLNQTR